MVGNALLMGLALFLMGTMAGGLVRILRGPTTADRMMAALLLGTVGVAVLLLLAQALQSPPLRDVALVFALLAAVSGVAFVRETAAATQAAEDPGHEL